MSGRVRFSSVVARRKCQDLFFSSIADITRSAAHVVFNARPVIDRRARSLSFKLTEQHLISGDDK